MKTDRKTLTFGILFIIVPFLGIPDSWKYTIITLLALLLILSSFKFRLHRSSKPENIEKPKEAPSFEENSTPENPHKIAVHTEEESDNNTD